MTKPTETPVVGMALRFFSAKTFGVLVTARVDRVGPRFVWLAATHFGSEWREKVVRDVVLELILDS